MGQPKCLRLCARLRDRLLNGRRIEFPAPVELAEDALGIGAIRPAHIQIPEQVVSLAVAVIIGRGRIHLRIIGGILPAGPIYYFTRRIQNAPADGQPDCAL